MYFTTQSQCLLLCHSYSAPQPRSATHSEGQKGNNNKYKCKESMHKTHKIGWHFPRLWKRIRGCFTAMCKTGLQSVILSTEGKKEWSFFTSTTSKGTGSSQFLYLVQICRSVMLLPIELNALLNNYLPAGKFIYRAMFQSLSK